MTQRSEQPCAVGSKQGLGVAPGRERRHRFRLSTTRRQGFASDQRDRPSGLTEVEPRLRQAQRPRRSRAHTDVQARNAGFVSTEVLTPRRRSATRHQHESFTHSWQVWRDIRTTFACALIMRRPLRTWFEPCAAAFSRSLDIRGGRPGVWTVTYPNKPINGELGISHSVPSDQAAFKWARAAALMFCRLCHRRSAGFCSPILPG